MKKQHAVTTAQVLEKVKDQVAPLPSQAAYMKDLAAMLAMHINRNLLIGEGYAPDSLPVPSCLVVAPTGQGKTYLLRKMVKALDLNLITVDCSTLVGESYKGVSLSQRIAGAMEEAKNEKASLSAKVQPKEVVDYTEKLTVLQYALEQYTNRDEGQDVPESVIKAFVVKIVVSKDGFDWYLRFDGDPEKPLHCELRGKRKTNTKIMVSTGCFPAMDSSSAGCHQNWGGISCTSNFPSVSRKRRSIDVPTDRFSAATSGRI